MQPQPPRRPTSRIVLLDADDRVLMLRAHDPSVTTGINPLPAPDFWMLVGGGVEDGEDFAAAIRREVFEETSIATFTLGPQIWRREKVVSWGGSPKAVDERFFVGRVHHPAVAALANLTAEEHHTVQELRWWKPADIDASPELFVPPELNFLIETALATGCV